MTMGSLVENICDGDTTIAHIVRAGHGARKTEFITDSQAKQQVGFIVYPKNGIIVRHIHRPYSRNLVGMSEVLLVRQGRVEVDFYSDQKRYLETRTLDQGDLVVLVGGGHGFRCLEDTILLEIKQGPYIGPEEKERF
jgi:hypothetical protein